MLNYSIALPISLIIVSFTLKLFIDRRTTTEHFVSCFIELSVDIIFFCMSFIGSYILTATNNDSKSLALLIFIISFVLSPVTVFSSRRANENFINGKKRWIAFTFLAYLIALIFLGFTIAFFGGIV